jgi:hypothetical protein
MTSNNPLSISTRHLPMIFFVLLNYYDTLTHSHQMHIFKFRFLTSPLLHSLNISLTMIFQALYVTCSRGTIHLSKRFRMEWSHCIYSEPTGMVVTDKVRTLPLSTLLLVCGARAWRVTERAVRSFLTTTIGKFLQHRSIGIFRFGLPAKRRYFVPVPLNRTSA